MASRFQKTIITIVLLTSLHSSLFGQLRLDTLGWRPPVDIPIFLSGNSCELRSGHFHAGIDIKTQGVEGLKVYAVQNGYISRIKISSTGYGKCIYITHPDGYTSVYAHLKEFNIQLEKYTKAIQYQKESFEVDIYPEKDELPVAQGDIIALSGNTGSSAGAHLHFEIRKTDNSMPLNGLLLGYDIKDNLPPDMDYLYVYPQDANSWVSRKNKSHFYDLKKMNGKFKLSQGDTIQASGSIGFGIKVDDLLNNSHNRCGINQIKMKVNDELHLHEQFDSISFDNAGYIKTLMDYKENVEKKRKLYKLFIEPNNKLPIYPIAINRGVIDFEKHGVSKITIQAMDSYKNQSELNFYVQANPVKPNKLKSNNSIVIPWQEGFQLDTAGVSISIPKESLYDTLYFEFKVDTTRKNGTYSNKYQIHNPYTPIHKSFTIGIEYDSKLEPLKDKLIITRTEEKKEVACGGIAKHGFIFNDVKEFGTYSIALDTIAPKIIPIGALATSKDLTNAKYIRFSITDNLSGLKELTGTINNQWVLFEWDPKNDLFKYEIDEKTPENGEFEIRIEATDERKNNTILKIKGYRNKLN